MKKIYDTILIGDVFIFNNENKESIIVGKYEIEGIKFLCITDEKRIKEQNAAFLNFKEEIFENSKFIRHVPQSNDFFDKNGNVLRPGINFKDKDNKEDDSVSWIYSISKNIGTSGEISYSQEEFKKDCIIQTQELKLQYQEVEKEIKKSNAFKSYLDKILFFYK